MTGGTTTLAPYSMRKSLLALVVYLGSSLAVYADAIDRPHFQVDGIAIVWSADGDGSTPIVSDFLIDDGATNTDLIAADAHTVITGTLTAAESSFPDGAGAALRIQRIRSGPNQDTLQGDTLTTADDVLTPFELRRNTDVRTLNSNILNSFYVATNVPFNIDVIASTSGDPADLDLIRLRMRVAETGSDDGLSFGTAAQFPHSGASDSAGVQWGSYRRLSRLTAGRDIFRGDRRTADAPGSIADQSVRFDLDYRWNTGNIDLSEGVFDVAADMVYTVYIP
ncbi:MAG: hypothetical protein AAF767_03470 [Pseudomonadota bacterium]